ncbi:hypothetical protein F511_13982 [Dorcoceras hygrometricum]|uniref:Uncharacterized protein n=1 Tax=Dorcoceras hygrometricum TaxID=472368 RepID=A0A2Z7AIV9_9LAMI|nr:hypothetical protein F511_13982 [Dorcoceras hygrometricum]
MSLFDLQDVCIAIGSIATLDLPMVVDLIGIYGLKGPYPQNRRPSSLKQAAAADLRRKFVSGQFDEEDPFVQNSSMLLVQPDEGVSVLFMDRIGDHLPQSTEKSRVLVIPVGARHKCQQAAAADLRRKFVSGQFDEEDPFVQNSSMLLVQPDEGVSVLFMDRIGDHLPQSTEKSRVLVIPVGARHKCQQGIRF